MITDYKKGYFYLTFTIVLISGMYLLTKLSIGHVNIDSFMLVFFLSAFAVGAFSTTLFAKTDLTGELRSHFLLILIISTLTIIGSYFLFLSVGRIGAAATSLLAKLQTVFAIIIGVLFLKERFKNGSWIALAVVISGSIMVVYKGGTFDFVGISWMIIFAVSNASQAYVIRRFSVSLDMMAVNVWRAFFIGIFFAATVLIKSNFDIPTIKLFFIIAMSGVMGGYLARGFSYLAFKYLPISMVTTMMNVESLLTVTLAAVFLNEHLNSVNLFGGAFMISGVVLLIFLERQNKSPKQQNNITAAHPIKK